ncbi:MAG: FAD:protein FMN transferase [Eubacteriales bacterium]|nr:FAD:protein FMN transferase [Eubacteriales bacterium]MDD3883165.1 FAD:protein FMN transferase [Eubacteriales bacterium]MDD4512452.1 FAD:protein FMN transferase [Eubacteriales bacterium]
MTSRRLRIRLPLLALICFSLLPLCGCGREISKSVSTFDYLDTIIRITVSAGSESEADSALSGCLDIIRDYHFMLDADGEGFVGRLNKSETVSLSAEEKALLLSALGMCAETDGALDISLYPLARLWDIGGGNHVPDEDEIRETLLRCGYEKLPPVTDEYALPAGMAIDLGAVAKGYIADKLSDYLNKAKVKSALIDLGGNIYALHEKTGGAPYRIAVQSPSDPSGRIAVVEGGDVSVVTSGTYQRYFDKDGRRYHHIFDRRTGAPAQSGLLSVTIIAPSSYLADCLSTAVFVMGEEKGAEYISVQSGVSAVFALEDGSAALYTGGEGGGYTVIMEGGK